MRFRRIATIATTITLAAGTAARAQEAPHVGVTMAYPTSVGIIWHVSDRIAIRPDVTFTGSNADAAPSGLTTSSWNVAGGVGALFYLKDSERVRTYLCPRLDYAYSRSRTETPVTGTITSSRSGAGGAASFGAEYKGADRFRVFGEVGFGFSHSTLGSTTTGVSAGGSNAWGLRSGVGVIFYP